MCDYDGSWRHISTTKVKTRRVHECQSCLFDWPIGTLMSRHFGTYEGDACASYSCPVCDFAAAQPEDSRMHGCWGWGHDWQITDAGDSASEVYEYLRYCLENNETPTVTGLDAALLQIAMAGEACPRPHRTAALHSRQSPTSDRHTAGRHPRTDVA